MARSSVTTAALGVSALQLTVWKGMDAWAQEAAPAVPAGTGAPGVAPGARPGMFETMMPFVLMFGVMYFLILRPQQKRMKEQQAMLAALATGDSVVTASGILGTIRELGDKVVGLEVANNVQVKVLRSQISQKLKNGVAEIQ
ncbi:MAG: preprotein translocase subunit YajC [Oligoflexia bacterium]